tara:strand:+ start:1981 stop:2436 length:456 start_codon:yes stop_codon:yes gene_type:complete
MKYVIIPYIALGLVLSLTIGIEYNCVGQEMFPEYYGSPFVFKQKSLGSSMEYFYSISGLILNIAVWSILIILIRLVILKLIKKTGENKIISKIYKGVVVVLIGFTTLNIAIDSIMIGGGFEKGLNYWNMDLDKEAKDWGMECEGEWIMFKK